MYCIPYYTYHNCIESSSSKTSGKGGHHTYIYMFIIMYCMPYYSVYTYHNCIESSSSKTSGKGGTSDDLLPKGVALSDFNPADSSEIFVKVCRKQTIILCTCTTIHLYVYLYTSNVRTIMSSRV